jgi:4-hydroxybenzoate polyprenyltransferase
LKPVWRELANVARGVTRWSEWFSSKVPLLLVAFSYHALLADLAPSALAQRFAAILVFICLGYAFGYAVNDFADRDVDRRAGKPNVMGRLRPAAAVSLLIGLAASGIATLWPFYHQPRVLELVLVSYAVGTLYSLPPVRFKERGWLGLLVSAAAQRSLPALIIAATFDDLGWEAALFACLLLLIGLRWILVHQVLDVRADRATGVRTYVTQRGREQVLWQLHWLMFPAEVALLGAVLVTMVSRLPALGLLLVPYPLWVALQVYVRHGPRSAFSLEGYERQPLADFYEIYWPLSLSLLFVISQPWLWPFPLVFILWRASLMNPGSGDAAWLLARASSLRKKLGVQDPSAAGPPTRQRPAVSPAHEAAAGQAGLELDEPASPSPSGGPTTGVGRRPPGAPPHRS